MATPSRPQFFCTRPDGTLTPLVALDELPTSISIRGVSRNLSAGETQGMTSCGLAAQRSEPWSVDGVAHSSEAGKEPFTDVHGFLLQVITNSNIPESMRTSAQAILFRGIDQHGIASEGAPSSALSPAAPTFYAKNHQMGNRNGPGSKKEYCSYWIRHGECCLYKHEMPVDMAMIEKLGLRDIPRWYREKYNVASLLQSDQARPHLAITDQHPMRALPSPDSPADSCASNTINANSKPKTSPQFNKSPPRGPANRAGQNGFGNYNHNRGGGRNGASNGFHSSNWKGSHRGGRNRNMGSIRQGFTGGRDGNRSADCSPVMGSPSIACEYGGFSNSLVRTPTTPAAVPATASITASTPGHIGAPMAANQSLLDDGNSHNRNFYWRLSELTECDEDMFDDASIKATDPHPRVQPLHMFPRGSNPSSNGGMMAHASPAISFDSNFSAFGRSDITRNVSAGSGSQSTAQMSFGPSTPQLGDLHIAENAPLTSAETRVTWGPIGGPILKRTSPPTESIVPFFGPYSNNPHTG
ncbi:hypothetical protein PENVUL_c008G08450 [Penicillium vulpinum]|uniref:C3H1-type domain-containing protein n=1 Tax=Penicillium vulpinum TaxID=29845 RepID=A0A1V6S4K1_9EURO|nr:hypothetical protein PENVUL_c008G08450 [Penicillium vulpinum]